MSLRWSPITRGTAGPPLIVALVLLALSGSARSAEPARRYAVIVGHDRSLDPDVAPLSYADDDAARYFELFRAAGAQVELFTVLDPEAQRRFPAAAREARPPKRDELSAGIAAVFARVRADRQAGRETHFYFVYSGHGALGPNREGYIHLLGDRLFRSQLYAEILGRSPATFNHLLLDACHAYFLVHKRGEGAEKEGDYRAAVADFLRSEDLASYPNTGVLLAASSESETHEWSRWEAGVFSHELRSALLGGADVDGDGRVTYAEAAAFVEAANAAVDVPRARLRVFYRAPAMRTEEPLMELAALAAPVLRVDPDQARRYFVEDRRGVRVADFHPTQEQALRVRLVGEAPFFLRTADAEAALPDQAEVAVRDLAFGPRATASRGGVEASFHRALFQIPFGQGFFQGRLSAEQRELERATAHAAVSPDARWMRRFGWASVAAAGLAAAAGGLSYGLATRSHDEYERATTADAVRSARKATEDRLLASRILAGTAAALAITGTTLLILDGRSARRGAAVTIAPAFTASGGGFGAGVQGRF